MCHPCKHIQYVEWEIPHVQKQAEVFILLSSAVWLSEEAKVYGSGHDKALEQNLQNIRLEVPI